MTAFAPPRLHVSLVTETFSPEVNGVAMTLGRLFAGLAARGHRMHCVRPRQHNERAAPTEATLLTPGLPIPGYPELRFGLPCADRLWQHWREHKPDVVHIATEGPLGYSALRAAHKLDIPVVSTFHTHFQHYSRHYGLGWLQGSIERYLRRFHNRTAHTLVPTEALAQALTQRGFANVGVLARGVDTALFAPTRRDAALRAAWRAAENDPVILVVSRMAAEKNLDLALRSFAHIRTAVPAARMVCVGDGPQQEALRQRYPDSHFVGLQQGETLARHYASADLFLFPSLTETWGNVVSEALASGLPVIAFDYAAAGVLIKNGLNGHKLEAADNAAFIDAAVALASALQATPCSRQRWRNTGPASIAHLDWARIYDRYEAILIEQTANAERRLHAATALAWLPD